MCAVAKDGSGRSPNRRQAAESQVGYTQRLQDVEGIPTADENAAFATLG